MVLFPVTCSLFAHFSLLLVLVGWLLDLESDFGPNLKLTPPCQQRVACGFGQTFATAGKQELQADHLASNAAPPTTAGNHSMQEESHPGVKATLADKK